MPSSALVISPEDRVTLESWTRSSTVSAGHVERARIVLAVADGVGTSGAARQVGVSRPTVIKWRDRFAAFGIDGLADEPRSGRPKTVDDAAILAATLEPPPESLAVTHWSSRLLGKHLGVGDATVARAWRRYGVKPWRRETFKFSTDPELEAKVRDVIGLYLNPPAKAIVLCVDEKSQIQALDRTAPILPMLPGTPQRATHDYKRHGTSSLYAALDIASGQVIGSLHARHRAVEFKKFLTTIDHEVPDHLDVHLVMDNASTHKTPAIQRWLVAHPRFVVHFTPTSSSWLNLVERWFSELTTKKLQRGAHTSVRALNADIRAWIKTWNENPRPYVWTKTSDQILESIARYCTRITDSGH
jgi:transposase